jgi:N4-gp56 family major capsid protein
MPYSPASNTTGTPTLAHLAQVLYRKKGLDRLEKKFVYRMACEPDVLEKQSGRTVQFFRYSNFGPGVAPTTEGNVGTGLQMTSRYLQATVSQYTAFITVSDLLVDTAIDPILVSAAELLGYRGGLSVDTMSRNIIDTEAPNTNQAALSGYLLVEDLRHARHSLQAQDVQPFEDGEFLCFASPFATYDLVNDPAAGGLADIFKYNTNVRETPLVKYEDRGHVATIAGCRVIETTNAFTYQSSGDNFYRVYVFGKGAVGSVDLAGKAPAKVRDPKKQRFNINVIKGEPQIADPEGVIGGAVSYNFATTTVVLDGPAGIGGTYRFRTLDVKSTVA